MRGRRSSLRRASTAATAVVLSGALLGSAIAVPDAATAAPPSPFGHACSPQNGVLFCPTDTLADRVDSFDGTPLDVDVTLPPGTQAGDPPLPTIVMLHGYGGSKVDFEQSSPAGDSPTDDTLHHYNNVFYAQRGYAVVNYSARGFGRSCGKEESSASTPDCLSHRSYVHLADQRWEARDTQYLLGRLVDQGITDPDAIGVTGISYGGGQSIELALLRDRIRRRDGSFARWRSPSGTPLEVTAAFPRWPWSDLVNSLLPNGRFRDVRLSPKGESRRPIGVAKQSYINGLFALGLSTGVYCGTPPRPTVCTDPTADLNRWNAVVQRGEPYGPAARRIARQIFEFHQGFGLPGRPAPLLLQSGWTDDLFPPSEAIRIYRQARARDPRARVAMQFGDLGHPRASNKENSDRALNNQGAAFFDRELKAGAASDRARRRAPRRGQVTAFTQTCPAEAPANGPFRARSYARLAPGSFRFTRERRGVATAGGGNSAVGTSFDPIAGTALGPLGGEANPCQRAEDDDAPGTVVARGRISRGFTLLGLPTVRARIDTRGRFGQLDSRLWDVAPGGEKTLVSRGAYRLTPSQQGLVSFQLHGNGYCLRSGHRPELELLGRDEPYLRRSNSNFSVAISNIRVSLPTAERHPVPRLRASVRPRRTGAGERTRFVVTVKSRDDRCATSGGSPPKQSVAVPGASVRFGGGSARTGRRGRAVLVRSFDDPGTVLVHASKPGYRRDSARVRVTAASAGPADGVAGGGGAEAGSGAGAGGQNGAGAGAVADDGGGLPFTGLQLGVVIAAGLALAAAGAALRRRFGRER